MDPIVFSSKCIAMQRISDAVAQGYSWWTSGEIQISSAKKFVKKFEINFQVFADRNLRARRKKHGLGNAKLVLWRHGAQIVWVLLVTAPDSGSHAAHSLERLKDVFKPGERIEIDGFELVRMPKGGDGAGGTRLTWRMTQQKYDGWRESIIEKVRKGASGDLKELLFKMWSNPGFHGIRSQIGQLVALYRAECKRASLKDAPQPPKRLPYLRRVKNHGDRLSYLLSQSN